MIKLFEKILDPFRRVHGLPPQDIADIVLMHVIVLIQIKGTHLFLYHSFLSGRYWAIFFNPQRELSCTVVEDFHPVVAVLRHDLEAHIIAEALIIRV